MKNYKKDTPFTLSRDAIRLFFAINFYLLAKVLGMDFELETEYVVMASIVIFGPLFCGWTCPFGAASYYMTRLGNKLFPKLQFNIPEPYDKVLRLIRYPLLAFFLYLFTIKGVSYFGDHIVMYKSTAFSWTFIKVKHWAVLFAPLFIPQFFCKYMCFQKAGYNLINRFVQITKIKRDTEICINCGKCDRVCPMQVAPSTKESICGDDCLSCYSCLDKDVCPSKIQALSFTMFGRKVDHVYFSVAAMSLYMISTYLILFVFKW